MNTQINENEKFLLTHISMFGSDAYPIAKRGRGWWVDGIRGCGGFPIPFRTKKEATARFEQYHALLLDRLAGRL